MPKPNRTVKKYFHHFTGANNRPKDEELWAIMDRVQRHELTPDEGAQAVKDLTIKRELDK